MPAMSSMFSERENLKRFQGQHPPLIPIDSLLKMPNSSSQSPSSKYPGVSAPFVAGRSILELRAHVLRPLASSRVLLVAASPCTRQPGLGVDPGAGTGSMEL